tara:strand:- start:262 stop:1095 length:834 start_codon:yes stop_codon:yes gene_type:complete
MNSTTSQYNGNIKIKDALSKYLKTDTPVSVGKMGNSEFIGLLHHVRGLQLSSSARQLVTVNAGVYPDTDKVLNDFFELYHSSLGTLDIAAKWISGDEDFLRTINSNIEMVELRSIEPYYHSDPWSSVLEGQSVVVVSPFSSTIESQYNKREFLWEDKRVLPDFDLHTVQSPYISLGQGKETNWFTALEGMFSEVIKKKPKIVLVGAGAYSLPLLMKLKQKGISGVHLGGSNQILFGIKGRRWDSHNVIGNFYNEHWVRPDGSEVPKDNHLIEEGCYW